MIGGDRWTLSRVQASGCSEWPHDVTLLRWCHDDSIPHVNAWWSEPAAAPAQGLGRASGLNQQGASGDTVVVVADVTIHYHHILKPAKPTVVNSCQPLLVPFATLFSNPTWRKAQVLLVGAILTPGQRTVAAALRVMGRSDQRDYARYHEVLNRAVWSPRAAAGILLVLLLQYLDQGNGPLVFGIDETLERRRGPKIKSLGIYRDAVRSSRSQLVKASGLRWISLMWLGHVPWAGRHWALPVLTVLAPSTRYYRQQGRRHKKLTDWARQMILQPRSW